MARHSPEHFRKPGPAATRDSFMALETQEQVDLLAHLKTVVAAKTGSPPTPPAHSAVPDATLAR